MEFEWDENKNRANLAKHGIAFEDAIRVFADPFYVSIQDRYVDGEERWQAIGQMEFANIILIAHTIRDGESDREVIRIISARKADRRERRLYEEGEAR